jgi:adenylate cyclase, class 2
MQTEIEAKVLDVDHEELRVVLHRLGATLEQPERLLRRYNLDYPDGRLQQKGGWIRIRDEGDKVTLSYKQLNDRTVHGTQEVSIVVDSFEQTKAFLEQIGLEVKTYQETKRESWRLGDAYIELDEWPWIKPYIEIEAGSEAVLQQVFERLGFSWKNAVFGSVEVVYRAEYDVTDEEVDNIPVITFETPLPEVLKRNRRQEV